jgi:hypothetical protein
MSMSRTLDEIVRTLRSHAINLVALPPEGCATIAADLAAIAEPTGPVMQCPQCMEETNCSHCRQETLEESREYDE